MSAPPKAGPRRAALRRLADAEAAGLAATLIFYEAPHRLAATLADTAAILGPRPAAICRELTKYFEEVRRDRLDILAAHYAVTPPRGEITLIIGPAEKAPAGAATLEAALAAALAQMPLKDAVAIVTAATDLPRRQVYAKALEMAKPDRPADESG